MTSQETDQKREYYERQSYVRYNGPIGDLITFNAEYGYLEAVLRGFRSAFLREVEYRQLCQCTNLEDFKLTLQDTDYAASVANLSQVTPDIMQDKVWDKYVSEFQFIRDQAVGPLATFLDFITYEYLISNISYLVTSMIRRSDMKSALVKCNPLGYTPVLKSIASFDSTTGEGFMELYKLVLIDTPVAPYFEKYFNEELTSEDPVHQIEQAYNEVEIEVINNMLLKMWLEDFYRYTQELGGTTAEIMKELLEFEADRRAIEITVNSFGSNLARDGDRKALYANFGKLYPEGVEAFSKVADMGAMMDVLNRYETFRTIWAKAQAESRSLQDALYAYEVHLNRLAFESQSHFACFYAYGKLKQQEMRNLYWISSCIVENREAKDYNRWIKIF
jgi:V-type H+-transporting ATPase subunit d